MPKSGLIVVDMLNDFIRNDGKLYVQGSEKIVKAIRDKLDVYRNNYAPVIFLCDQHDKDDKEFDRFPPHAIGGTDGSLIIEELGFQQGPLERAIGKTRFSGFFNTPLESVLKTFDVKVWEVCGVCTSICIMDTVGGLANLDYKTILDTKCVADLPIGIEEASIKRMKTIYDTTII